MVNDLLSVKLNCYLSVVFLLRAQENLTQLVKQFWSNYLSPLIKWNIFLPTVYNFNADLLALNLPLLLNNCSSKNIRHNFYYDIM